ncbi:hypothetical protein HZH66_004951 [Vespula vulgaris]|uniref:Uncharacterized protein n=1 Tax=Vespula vulgaris TaxID=7454 RepID=A0A834K906_VESVU|nr:hypothetical protein HZH66_004951 [Vespula vulgaris]
MFQQRLISLLESRSNKRLTSLLVRTHQWLTSLLKDTVRPIIGFTTYYSTCPTYRNFYYKIELANLNVDVDHISHEFYRLIDMYPIYP